MPKILLNLSPPAPFPKMNWDDMIVEQRLRVLREAQKQWPHHFKARLIHKVLYGRWNDIGKRTQNILWIAWRGSPIK